MDSKRYSNLNLNQKDRIKASLSTMHQNTTSSTEFDRMLRSVRYFADYFGLNHFYYARMTNAGYYTTIGTNCIWHEHVFEHPEIMQPWPTLRHPDSQPKGLLLVKHTSDNNFRCTLEHASNEFNIHFILNINRRTAQGMESFGFGARTIHPKAEEHILNEIPLVKKFVDYFLEEP